MKKLLEAVVLVSVLLGARSVRATPSTVLWTPATTYTQPFLVPHLTYDSYVAEKSFVPNDYGLTIGVIPSDKIQGEVGFDVFQPGKLSDLFQLNGKIALVEGAFGAWQPGVSGGIMNAGFKKDVSNYDVLHLEVGKSLPFGTIVAGGYYGAGSKLLWSDEDGKVNRAGFMGSYTTPDLTLNLTGLQKINAFGDLTTGKNWFGAGAVGIGLYPTSTVDVLVGPVWFLDSKLAKGIYGADMVWTVQLDIDFDLRPPKPAPPAQTSRASRGRARARARPRVRSWFGDRSALDLREHGVEDEHLDPLAVLGAHPRELERDPHVPLLRLEVGHADLAGERLAAREAQREADLFPGGGRLGEQAREPARAQVDGDGAGARGQHVEIDLERTRDAQRGPRGLARLHGEPLRGEQRPRQLVARAAVIAQLVGGELVGPRALVQVAKRLQPLDQAQRGRHRYPWSAFFSSGAGLNPTVLVGAIWISAPVFGLRPTRPARRLTTKVPNPGMEKRLSLRMLFAR